MISFKVTLILLAVLLAANAMTAPRLYHKVTHGTDPEAKCLDGSPAFLYVHEGGLSDHILIFMLGGGICGDMTKLKTLESCYQRSKTYLGSNYLWTPLLAPQLAQGYLSVDPEDSAFANWTKIFIPYCDGSLHQGNAKEPVQYKDTKLYFRGSVNTRSHFKWIDMTYGLKNASKIILTGMSAGGIATNSWSNYLKNYVGDDSKVYSIADSGIFNKFDSITGISVVETVWKNLFSIANADQLMPLEQCNKEFPGEQWRCAFVEDAAKYIKGRFMVINSQYDAWNIENFLMIDCMTESPEGYTLTECNSTQMAYIEKYRTSYLKTVNNFLEINQELSVWSISCAQHVYACWKGFYDDPMQKIPTTTGKTVRDVVEAFVLRDERSVVIDEVAWPGNTGCAK